MRRIRVVLPCALVAACASPTEPLAPAGPTLHAAPAEASDGVRLVLEGASAGAQVMLLSSSFGVGPGICPPGRGACADVVAAEVIADLRASAQGDAEATSDPGLHGDRWYQALVRQPGGWVATPVVHWAASTAIGMRLQPAAWRGAGSGGGAGSGAAAGGACDPADPRNDLDGDGYLGCADDCDDADPAVYPRAPEVCDLKKNDCSDSNWILTDEATARFVGATRVEDATIPLSSDRVYVAPEDGEIQLCHGAWTGGIDAGGHTVRVRGTIGHRASRFARSSDAAIVELDATDHVIFENVALTGGWSVPGATVTPSVITEVVTLSGAGAVLELHDVAFTAYGPSKWPQIRNSGGTVLAHDVRVTATTGEWIDSRGETAVVELDEVQFSARPVLGQTTAPAAVEAEGGDLWITRSRFQGVQGVTQATLVVVDSDATATIEESTFVDGPALAIGGQGAFATVRAVGLEVTPGAPAGTRCGMTVSAGGDLLARDLDIAGCSTTLTVSGGHARVEDSRLGDGIGSAIDVTGPVPAGHAWNLELVRTSVDNWTTGATVVLPPLGLRLETDARVRCEGTDPRTHGFHSHLMPAFVGQPDLPEESGAAVYGVLPGYASGGPRFERDLTTYASEGCGYGDAAQGDENIPGDVKFFLSGAVAGGAVATWEQGNTGEAFVCDRNGCRADPKPGCGDGDVDPGEGCDDANLLLDDGCAPNCQLEGCGDGRVVSGEACDDGNTAAGDGCSPTCEWEICGDGVIDPGQACDDGNAVRGDGCSPQCVEEVCGNAVVESGEACDAALGGCDPACDVPIPAQWAQVSLGAGTGCGLRTDGTAQCWGTFYQAEGDRIESGLWRSVAAGVGVACAIDLDDQLFCFGTSLSLDGRWDPDDTVPEFHGPVAKVVLAGVRGCAVGKDKSWGCWSSQTSLDWMAAAGAPPTGVLDLDMNPSDGNTGCFVLDDGSIRCGAVFPSAWSVVRPGAWVEVEVRSSASYCGRDVAGSVSCWSNTTPVEAPTAVFNTLVATRGAWCGLREDETVACWGTTDTDGIVAGVPAGTFRWVEAGQSGVCAGRDDGTYTCWGTGSSSLPRPHGPFTDVSATASSVCGVTTDGELVCRGSGSTSPSFTALASTARFWTVAALSDNHGCAVDDTGALACWALSSSPSATVLTPPAGAFTDVAVGATFGCAINVAREVECFGTSSSGSTSPPAGPFVEVDAMAAVVCGRRPDGTVVCWGAPTPPSFPGTWRALDLGTAAAALRTDGTQASWSNTAGLLLSTDRSAVDLIGMASQSRWTSIDASGQLKLSWAAAPALGDAMDHELVVIDGVEDHLCGVTTSGAIVCWGTPAVWLPAWAGY